MDKYQWSPLAISLIALVGCIGLTNGRAADKSAHPQPAAVQQTESHKAPAFTDTNSKHIYLRHRGTGEYLSVSASGVTCATEPGDAGLWKARYNGEFTPDGDMLIFSVFAAKSLSTDDQGNLNVNQSSPDRWAHWFRHAGPLGVQVISLELKNGHIRLEEQGQVKAVVFGRDLRSQWDMIQLD